MSRRQITVSIAGGSKLERAALEALLSGAPGLQAIPLDMEFPPRVLVMDARHGEMPELSSLQEQIAILVLAYGDERKNIPVGAMGLISPEETPEALFAAIRQVARGEQYLSPLLAVALLENRRADPEGGRRLNSLSEREREILDLLAQGQGNKSIAAHLYLSVRTVEGHLASIYSKLGVHSRTEAMLVAVQGR